MQKKQKIGQGDKMVGVMSRSLWNYVLAPGWSEQEVEILKNALMKFGFGSWRKIEE